MESVGLDSYDVLYLIFHHFDNQADRRNASLTCNLWNSVIHDLTKKFVENYKSKYSFKVTKVRFLVRKKTIIPTNIPLLINMFKAIAKRYPILHCRIFNTETEYCELPIYPISEDNEFIIYESNESVPAWKLERLKWQVFCKEYNPSTKKSNKVLLHSNYQIVYDDLCYYYFRTGLRYRSNDEEIVIGSTGNDICCCCAISLLPQ